MVQINENNKSDNESIINLIPINEVEFETDVNDEENVQMESAKDIENI